MSYKCLRCKREFDEKWRFVRHLRDSVACRKFAENMKKNFKALRGPKK